MSSGGQSVPFEYWGQWWNSVVFVEAMLAGAVAGFAADVALFPLDALKTRLQAPGGFSAAGGSAGVYRGLGVALAGSVPCSSLFFCVYETTKTGDASRGFDAAMRNYLGVDPALYPETRYVVVCGTAAAAAEIVVSAVRTPLEALKRRCQTSAFTPAYAARVRARPALLWRGWSATVLRDVPFSLIQSARPASSVFNLRRRRRRRARDARDPRAGTRCTRS